MNGIKKIKILNLDHGRFDKKAKDTLNKIGYVDEKNLDTNQLRNIIKMYNILIVGLENSVDSKIIDNGTNLNIIATSTTGLDHIDTNAAMKKNIRIVSLNGENKFLSTISSTAEYTFGLILSLIRQIPTNISIVKNYTWERDIYQGIQLKGKTIGIIGFGRLGRMIAQYANGFEMNILTYDPILSNIDPKFSYVTMVRLKKLLSSSDIITIHASLNESTENLIGPEEFNSMKKGCYLVNTSRGKLVDENALLNSLDRGQLKGAALDVLANETDFSENFPKNKLIEYSKINKNLIITPHVAGLASDAVTNTRYFIAKKIVNEQDKYFGV